MLVAVLAVASGACSSGSSGATTDGSADATADAGSLTGTFTASGSTPCLTGSFRTVSGEAQCLVTETFSGADGAVEVSIPSCNESGTDPCWELVASPFDCANGLDLQIVPDTTQPTPADASYTYQCARS
jgi:hypothetical protein